MKAVIVYGSQYGTTKQYAEKFSEITGLPVVNYEKIKSLADNDIVLHFGGLYAGGVKGLKNTIKALGENTRLIIVTVGLSDVNDKENTDNIKKSITRQVPEQILKNAEIFHLRGGIDYKKLNLTHKTMMTLLYNKAKKIPEEQRNAETQAMIDTFNTKVDFIDFGLLAQIAETLE